MDNGWCASYIRCKESYDAQMQHGRNITLRVLLLGAHAARGRLHMVDSTKVIIALVSIL